MTLIAPPRRIHIIGNSGSGKSTLAARLANLIEAPVVELDALNWEPGWVGLNETNPAEFERRIRNATSGDAWVVAGSYSGFAKRLFWPRVECVIWLDFPASVLVWRVLRRSWRRWRTRELLWGTNRERFLPQLAVWSKKSLVWWILSQQRRRRREMRVAMLDPQWAHIRFLRLASAGEIDALAASFMKTWTQSLQEGTNLYHH